MVKTGRALISESIVSSTALFRHLLIELVK